MCTAWHDGAVHIVQKQLQKSLEGNVRYARCRSCAVLKGRCRHHGGSVVVAAPARPAQGQAPLVGGIRATCRWVLAGCQRVADAGSLAWRSATSYIILLI